MNPTRTLLLSALLLAAGLLIASCGGDDKALSLVAYSTPMEAYEEIIPAFGGDVARRELDLDPRRAS